MIARGAVAGLLGLMLAGCSTTGPIVFNCNGFEGPRGYGQVQTPSAYVRQIRGEDAPGGGGEAKMTPLLGADTEGSARILTLDEALRQAEREAANAGNFKANAHPLGPGWSFTDKQPIVADLLLSGGGQWGAFGAGFLSRLHEQEFDRTFHLATVTGVSTGAFQAMFVGAGTDADYRALAKVYAPASERKLVRRYPNLLVPATGEMAAIGRLRRNLEDALCDRRKLARAVKAGEALTQAQMLAICPLVGRLARAGGSRFEGEQPVSLTRNVFIGMVRADDGQFVMVNAAQVARDVFGQAGQPFRPVLPQRLHNAQQCLAATGLASAAMPLFYQQVRIGDPSHDVAPRTYFDGGVRQSVFEAQYGKERATARDKQPIFVLRNGPTALLTRSKLPGERKKRDRPGPDPDVNATASPLDMAMRAEKIVVNQVEVQSIADLRLTNPDGPIYFVTADGFHQFKPTEAALPCSKRSKNIMFDPAFMPCLQGFGIAKANKGTPELLLLDAWQRLRTAREVQLAPAKE